MVVLFTSEHAGVVVNSTVDNCPIGHVAGYVEGYARWVKENFTPYGGTIELSND